MIQKNKDEINAILDEYCTCYGISFVTTKELAYNIQELLDKQPGKVIADSNGFIEKTMIPETAFNLAKEEGKREAIAELTSKVTRFEVIDHRNSPDVKGRIVVEHNVNAELSLQDDGRTLKVFLTDTKKG